MRKIVFTIVHKPKYAISELIMDCHITQLTDHFKYLGIHFIAGKDLSVDIAPIRRQRASINYGGCDRFVDVSERKLQPSYCWHSSHLGWTTVTQF